LPAAAIFPQGSALKPGIFMDRMQEIDQSVAGRSFIAHPAPCHSHRRPRLYCENSLSK